MLDDELRYVYVNAAGARWAGRVASEMIGRHLFEVFPTLRGSALDKQMARAVDTRETIRFDHAASTGSGNRYEMLVVPLARGGVLFRARNVTELRRSEALAHSQMRVLSRI